MVQFVELVFLYNLRIRTLVSRTVERTMNYVRLGFEVFCTATVVFGTKTYW